MNDFLPSTKREEAGALIPVEQERAMAEVQAAIVVAKRFPRDQNAAYMRILEACKRKSLAEQAEYVYPRGGTTVTGPSIRLAEVIAQNWGNIDYGMRELSQRLGESDMQAYAWDLETNTRVTRTFVVRHQRKARGEIRDLTDPRDIYEMAANQGQRRVRACILEVIPGDVLDAAREQCNKTLEGSGDEPIADRIRKIVKAFTDYGVTQQMLEKRLGHKLDAVIEQELVVLRKIYQSLKDGIGKREDYFDLSFGEKIDEGGTSPLKQKLMEEADVETYPCPYCDFTSSSKSGITRHVNKCPERIKPVIDESPPPIEENPLEEVMSEDLDSLTEKVGMYKESYPEAYSAAVKELRMQAYDFFIVEKLNDLIMAIEALI